jgi:hypothetical protein
MSCLPAGQGGSQLSREEGHYSDKLGGNMDPPRLDGKDDTVWREESLGYLFREAGELSSTEKDFVCVDGSPGADKAVR